MLDLVRNIQERQTSAGPVYDVRLSIKGHGRQFKGGFATRTEAAKWRDKIERAVNADAMLRQERLRLPQVVEVWLRATKPDKMGSTIAAQVSALNVHIKTELDVPVEHVTAKLLEDFVKELPKRLPEGKGRGNGWSTAKRVVDMVKASLRWAARPDVKLIDVNPIRDVPIKLPRPDKSRRAVAGQDFVKLIKAAKTPQRRLLWHLIGYTGCRRGEITALRWSDIDFEEAELRIDRIATPESKGRVVQEGRVKMNQRRTVPLDEGLVEALRAAYRAGGSSINGYIFPSPRVTGPIGFSAVQRWWEQDCEAAGIKSGADGYTIHGLRHMFTTLLLDSGEDLKVVSRILGHSSVRTTQDVYRHVSDSHKKKSIKKLPDLLGGNGKW